MRNYNRRSNLMKGINADIRRLISMDNGTVIEEIISTVFKALMDSEREMSLEETRGMGNKGNGYYTRMARGLTRYFKLQVPRDRLGLFHPVFLEYIKSREIELSELAYKLYVKGLTTLDIEKLFKEVYGKKMSRSKISMITKSFAKERELWQNKPLSDNYYFLYIDATYVNVRRGRTVEKEAFYTVLGVKENYHREILGVYNIPTESAEGWREVARDLKKRGLKRVVMIISDELTGIEKVMTEEFKGAKHQICITHKKRNILKKVRVSDKDEMVKDLKEVFELESKDYTQKEALERTEAFIQKWKVKYKGIRKKLPKNKLIYYFSYLEFPPEIHRMIYTTNWIERLNKSIKRTVKMRNSFPNPESALNLICACLMDIEEEVYIYPVSSFAIVRDELQEMLDALRHN